MGHHGELTFSEIKLNKNNDVTSIDFFSAEVQNDGSPKYVMRIKNGFILLRKMKYYGEGCSSYEDLCMMKRDMEGGRIVYTPIDVGVNMQSIYDGDMTSFYVPELESSATFAEKIPATSWIKPLFLNKEVVSFCIGDKVYGINLLKPVQYAFWVELEVDEVHQFLDAWLTFSPISTNTWRWRESMEYYVHPNDNGENDDWGVDDDLGIIETPTHNLLDMLFLRGIIGIRKNEYPLNFLIPYFAGLAVGMSDGTAGMFAEKYLRKLGEGEDSLMDDQAARELLTDTGIGKVLIKEKGRDLTKNTCFNILNLALVWFSISRATNGNASLER